MFLQENVAFVEVCHKGWPLVFVVAVTDIFGGDEVLWLIAVR